MVFPSTTHQRPPWTRLKMCGFPMKVIILGIIHHWWTPIRVLSLTMFDLAMSGSIHSSGLENTKTQSKLNRCPCNTPLHHSTRSKKISLSASSVNDLHKLKMQSTMLWNQQLCILNSASTASAKIPVACSICWCVLSASSAQMPGQANAVLFVTNVWCTGNLSAIPFMVKPVKPLYSKTAITYMQTKQYSNIYNSQQHELQDITHLSLTALIFQLKLIILWTQSRKIVWRLNLNLFLKIEIRHLRASYTSL